MELRTHRLIYGSYPELERLDTDWTAKKEYLMQMVNDYLLKDILEFEGIRHSAKIYELLKLIALQLVVKFPIKNLRNSWAFQSSPWSDT